LGEKKEKEEKKAMDRLAKEAKKGKDQPEEKGISTVKGALDRIKSKTKARAALKELVQAGFDETTIVQIVLSYCGGTEEQVKEGLTIAIKFVKELGACSRQLIKDAERVERIIAECEKYDRAFHVEGQSRGELADKMRKFAHMLSEAGKRQQANLKQIRLGGKTKRDRKTKKIGKSELDIKAGREQSLVYLAYLITGGEKPTAKVYALIAPLVAALTGESELDCALIVGRLQRSVTRFENDNLGLCYLLAVEALQAFESRHAQLSPSRT
jgi:hypothetical protein